MISRVAPRYFELARPYLERAINYSDGRYSPLAVFEDIKSGNQQLWVITEGNIIGAATTKIVDYPERRTLFIQFMSGDDFSFWRGEGYERIAQYAKEKGCDSIEFFGRPGLKKHARELGFEATYTVFERKL